MVQSPAEMQMHDDLATLLAQRLTLGPAIQQQQQQAPQQQQQQQAEPAAATQITYSISQHYHHSAHIAKPSAPAQPPAPSPAQDAAAGDLLQTAQLLASHGVNPEALSPALVELFRTADEPLKTGLVGFWRLLPEQQQQQGQQQCFVSPQSTEEMTRLFLLAREQQRSHSAPIISLQDSSSGRWPAGGGAEETEPYMLSGYEQMARREYERQAATPRAAAAAATMVDAYSPLGSAVGRGNGAGYSAATDPVYRMMSGGGAQEEWARQRQRQQQAMEDQYGALMQMRDEEMEL
ncbi:uncharacterized protein E0L32_003547 [Thyridium curvatum]|uniref:Uncharacterized protein n=1 Tax=Thyridium curvatum TaxID=1093900 RepID=A0A507B1K7_9PEZI|nr:uncharacterized protein E0L32_003547 [Thyridium curvatum]TPX16985.1 hypothetical protein E0L32_003547 [Thyridium curvatum]